MGRPRAHLVALDPVTDDALEATPGVPVPLPALDLPSARRPGWPTLAALAAGCGVVAIVLGAWALVASIRSSDAGPPDPTVQQAVAVLTNARAERILLHGSVGRVALVVDPEGKAVLALDGLGRAPDGRTYAAWVVPAGSATPQRIGTFIGTRRAVPLDRRVGHGALVAITLEVEPPPERPSRPLRVSAVRP